MFVDMETLHQQAKIIITYRFQISSIENLQFNYTFIASEIAVRQGQPDPIHESGQGFHCEHR